VDLTIGSGKVITLVVVGRWSVTNGFTRQASSMTMFTALTVVDEVRSVVRKDVADFAYRIIGAMLSEVPNKVL